MGVAVNSAVGIAAGAAPGRAVQGWPVKSYWLNIGNYPRQSISMGAQAATRLAGNMKVAILAEAPTALVELCGVSMLERLLRTLQRVGVPEVVIISSTGGALEEELAKPSRF